MTRYIEELKLRDGASMEVTQNASQLKADTQQRESHVAPEQRIPGGSADDRRPMEADLPAPRAVYNKGVLHNELPSPLPSPRDKQAGWNSILYIS